jgi:hypothetical protein
VQSLQTGERRSMSYDARTALDADAAFREFVMRREEMQS